jgi:hypothetical protein
MTHLDVVGKVAANTSLSGGVFVGFNMVPFPSILRFWRLEAILDPMCRDLTDVVWWIFWSRSIGYVPECKRKGHSAIATRYDESY